MKTLINPTPSECIKTFLNKISRKPGLKLHPDPDSYPYQIEATRMNTDPFVRKSMKLFDSELYEDLSGYTKKANLSNALETLSLFANPERSRSQFPKQYSRHLDAAISKARQVFVPSEKLYRFSLAHGCDNMNLDAAAGFSFPGKKKMECIDEAYDVAAYMQHRIQRGIPTYHPPCKLALRGHLSTEEESKSRPVWVYPYEVSILEAKWAVPFYEHLEKNVPTVHFGERAMPRLAQMMMGGLNTHDESAEITTDWSSFDATIPCWLINTAFEIIWDSFDNQFAYHEGAAVYGGPVMEEKNRLLFHWVKEYFLKTKIMLPDGTCVRKEHGIPSGSFFTQAVGSIVNFIVIEFMNSYFNWHARRIRVLGDDCSFLVPLYNPRKVDPQQIRALAWFCFGLVLKLGKLRIATDQSKRSFLGYHVEGNRFTRSDREWLLLVLHPERDVETLEQSMSRVLAYYILGGVNSELYCRFFWDYVGRYPDMSSRPLKVGRGMKRMFKYVFRLDIDILRLPDLRRLDPLSVPMLFSCGDRPFY